MQGLICAVIVSGLVSTMLVPGQGAVALAAVFILSAMSALAMRLRPAPRRAQARARTGSKR